MSQNPYLEYAQSFRRLHTEGRSLPFGGMPKPEKTEIAEDAPVALILSPHPASGHKHAIWSKAFYRQAIILLFVLAAP